ncbi:MAG TPA: hypothetical protein VKP30_18110, partial [Polyangiaceae bacterium]|nr:hypothetical protein [Polyangiaceae bacterium]
MKIEITIPTPGAHSLRYGAVASFVVVSLILALQFGLAAWLLWLGFCLLLLSIGLAWASVTTASDSEEMTLEEALDLAAPARDEERKLAVLRGIKDLEYERSLGKISEQDYQDLIRRYRGDAKQLLQKLDTSEASLRQRAMDLVAKRLAETSDAKQSTNSDAKQSTNSDAKQST